MLRDYIILFFMVLFILMASIETIQMLSASLLDKKTEGFALKDYFTESTGDYRLNDIHETCGKFDTIQELASACKNNKKCRGFNIISGKPGCLKHKLQNKSKDPKYKFFTKNPQPTYTFKEGEYEGNDFNCGKYNSMNEIRTACDKNDKCVGFNLRNSTPHCLKSKLVNQIRKNDFTIYTKHAPN